MDFTTDDASMLVCQVAPALLRTFHGCRYAMATLNPDRPAFYPPLVVDFEPITVPYGRRPASCCPEAAEAGKRLLGRTQRAPWDLHFGIFFGTEFFILP